jgi:Flp pilus assembly protein TadD
MRKVIELDETHAEALNYLGYTYAELGINLDEAEDLINRALSYKPDDGFILDSLGWVYYMKGRFEEAVTYLEKATGFVQDDPTILEHLGDAYMKIENEVKALEAYQKALQHKETDKDTLEKKIEEIKKKHGQDQ